jgi:DNA-binding transcriptional LysR family regulator
MCAMPTPYPFEGGHRLTRPNRLVSAFEAAAAGFSYRETGNPFPATDASRPTLRLGLCSSLSWGFLRDLIRHIHTQPGAPALSFLQGAPRDIIRAARRGEIDVGFVYGRRPWARLEYETLWREPLMVLMSDQHRLARDNDIRPDDLRDETFLVAGDQVERERHIGLLQNVIGETPSAVLAVPVEQEMLIDLVSLGFGLALAPASSRGAFHPGVSYRPIAAPVEPITFHAVWRRSNRNEALGRLLEAARELAAGPRV